MEFVPAFAQTVRCTAHFGQLGLLVLPAVALNPISPLNNFRAYYKQIISGAALGAWEGGEHLKYC